MKSGIKRKQASKPFTQNKRAKITKKQKEEEEEKKYMDDDDDDLVGNEEEEEEDFEVGPEALRKHANDDLDLSDDDVKDKEIVQENQEESSSDDEETVEQAKLKMVKKFLDKTRNFLKEKEEGDEGKKDEVQMISEYLDQEKKKQKQKFTHQGLAARIKKINFSEKNFHVFKGNSPHSEDAHVCTLSQPSNCVHYFQQGHKNTVSSVAVSPKEPNLVFTAGLDCCIIQWDLLTGKKTIISKGEKKNKPKPKKLSKAKQKTKNLPKPSGTEYAVENVGPKNGHTDAILTMDISNDGKFLATAGKDKVIKIWDVKTQKFLFQFNNAHSNWVTSISFNKLKLGKEVAKESKNDEDDGMMANNEFSVDFAKETNTLASTSMDLTLKMWDVDDQMFYQTLHGHEAALLGVDCITRNITATSSVDTTVRVWKVEEETQLIFGGKKLALSDAADAMEKAKLTKDDDLSAQLNAKLNEAKPALFTDVNGKLDDKNNKNLADNSTRNPLARGMVKRSGHIYPVDCVKFLGSPKWFVSGSQDGSIMVWNYEKKRCVAVYEEAHGGAWISAIGVPKFAFGSSLDQKLFANEQVFATGSSDGFLKFWKFDTNAKFGSNKQTIQFLNQVRVPGHINAIDFGTIDESSLKNMNLSGLSEEEKNKIPKKLDFVVCAVGRSHTLGRWGNKADKEVKNGIYVVKINP